MKEIDGKIYYSRPETAKRIGVTRQCINAWTRDGRLKFRKFPNLLKNKHCYFIEQSVLNEFIMRRTNKFNSDKLFRGERKEE